MPRPPKPRGYLSGHGRGFAHAGPVTITRADGSVEVHAPIKGKRVVASHKVRMQPAQRGNGLTAHLWAGIDSAPCPAKVVEPATTTEECADTT
jgi:hypothetical protein